MGSSEAAPAFQGLFADDPSMGYRLKPGARVRFATTEFDTALAVNSSGVRDDDEIGAKTPDERRILILGDSLVMAVQVPFQQTFWRAARTASECEAFTLPIPRHQRRGAGVRPGRGAPAAPRSRAGHAAGRRHRNDFRRQRRRGSGNLGATPATAAAPRRCCSSRRPHAFAGWFAEAWCCRCCACVSRLQPADLRE